MTWPPPIEENFTHPSRIGSAARTRSAISCWRSGASWGSHKMVKVDIVLLLVYCESTVLPFGQEKWQRELAAV